MLTTNDTELVVRAEERERVVLANVEAMLVLTIPPVAVLETTTELEAEPQLKPMECTPIEHPDGALFPGLKVTFLAPPHCVF